MRKRSLLGETTKGKPIIEANYSDICFYDKENDDNIIVSVEQFNPIDFPLSQYTPIGIVVIPSSHTEEQRPRITSLVLMDVFNPDNGNVTNKVIEDPYCGGRGYNIGDLIDKIVTPYLESLTEDSKVLYEVSSTVVLLPCDDNDFNYPNPLNSKEYFLTERNLRMCSPYKEDGSKEMRYFDTSDSGNVLADFDGKGNTEKILAEDNSYSTLWQTASTIYNNNAYDNQIHPSAQCCWRFHTEGTSQGEWYLPSCGELGYLMCRRVAIQNTIDILNNSYNQIIGGIFDTNNSFQTSTEFSAESMLTIGESDINVTTGYKSAAYNTVAFLKL